MRKSVKSIPNVKLYDMTFHNIEDFIDDSHPTINGYYRLGEYMKYWEPRLQKTIEGCWGHDYDKKTNKGGWRFMTADLYFFRNFFTLEMGPNRFSRPILRGIDWYLGYSLAEMDGFSGFEGDLEWTCHDVVRKIELGIPLKMHEQAIVKRCEHNLRKPDGSWKRYMKPQNYLWQHFKEPMGKALYESETKNMMWVTSRRLGKSYHGISKIQRSYCVDGATSMEEFREGDTRFIAAFCDYGGKYSGENQDKFWKSYGYLEEMGAYKTKEYTREKGDLDGMGFFWEPHSGGKEIGERQTNQVKEEGGKGTVGQGSSIGRASFEKSASAAVGIAANAYLFEEVGTYRDFITPHEESNKATERDEKFGWILSIGTGGDFDYIDSVRTPFKDPSSIKAVEFPDLWTKGGGNICGFVPVQYRKLTYYDELGNHKQQEAFEDCIQERVEASKTNEVTYLLHVAGFPMQHQDVFIDTSASPYPKMAAAERLSEVELRRKETDDPGYEIGRLDWPGKGRSERNVFFSKDLSLRPILTHEDVKKCVSDGFQEGAFLRYAKPGIRSKGVVLFDPVALDVGTSLASAYAYEFFREGEMTNRFVGEWNGRFDKTEKNGLMAIKMALYFGFTLMAERNVGDVDDLISRYGLYDICEPVPLDGIRFIKPNYTTNLDWGFHKTGHIKPQLDWLTGQMMISKIGEVQQLDGSYKDQMWISGVDSELLLNDVRNHTEAGNYDALSAVNMLSLVIKQYEIAGAHLPELRENNDLMANVAKALVQQRGYESNINRLLGRGHR